MIYSNRQRTLQILIIISPGTAGVTEMLVIAKPVRTSSPAVTLRPLLPIGNAHANNDWGRKHVHVSQDEILLR